MEKEPLFSIDKREDPNYPVYFEESKIRKSKKPFLIFGVVILFVLLGMTAVLASRIWDPLWNPFRPSPERVLAKSFEVHKTVKTYHYQAKGMAEFTGYTTQMPEVTPSFEIQLEGDVDNSDKETPKSKVDFSSTIFSVYTGPLGFPFSGKSITIGKVAYYKIEKLPLVGLYEQIITSTNIGLTPEEQAEMEMVKGFFSQIIEQIQNKWIRVDPEEIEKELGISFKGITKEEEEKLKAKIEELLVKYPPIKPEKELKDQVIEGRKYYHYLTRLDKENLKKFLSELLQFTKEEKIAFLPGLLFSEEEINKMDEEISKVLDELFQSIKSSQIEIWIDKKTYYLHRIKGELIVEDEEGKLEIGLDSTFSNYNQPVKIVAPAESISVTELIGQLFGLIFQQSFMQGANKAKDARIISDLVQLRTIAALIYGYEMSYQNLCKNGDLNVNHPSEGEYLKTLREDILSQGSQIVCFATKTKYCIKASLLAKPGQAYCVDSEGRAQEVSGNICTPTNISCAP